jgi:hypothetical protein
MEIVQRAHYFQCSAQEGLCVGLNFFPQPNGIAEIGGLNLFS